MPLTRPTINERKPRRHPRIAALLFDVFVDVIIAGICLAGAGAAFYFFYTDLNKSLTKLNEKPIANVHLKKNTTQRRFGDRVVWDMLQQDSPVYHADTVHTADMSEVEINYFNEDGGEGTGFSLEGNTLVQVFSGRVELAAGKIDIFTRANGMRLKLVSAGTVVDIGENSVVSANSTEANGGSIQVLEGRAQITTADGVQEAAAGEALAVNAAGKRQTAAQVALLAPKPNGTVLAVSGGGAQPVDFSWRAVNFKSGDFVRFEIGADQRFGRVVQMADVRSASAQTVTLPPGTYWWRAYPVNESENGRVEAEQLLANKFSVIAAGVPKLIQPADGATIRFAGDAPSLRLQWATGAGDVEISRQNFIVAVANNPEMRNPSFQQELRGQTTATATGLTAGRWYWQVSPVFDTGAAPQLASRSAAFLLEKGAVSLNAPALLSPADGANINALSGIMLAWQSEGMPSYTVQIARGGEFAEPALNQNIATNFFNVRQTLSDGVWYWRVAARDGADAMSAWSAARSFVLSTASVPVELVFPREGWTTSEAALPATPFSWRVIQNAPEGGARLQIAVAQDFTRLSADVPGRGGSASSPALPAGNYFWRVFVPNGSFATPPRRFTVTSGRIILEEPAANAEIDGLIALKTPPSLRWSVSEPLARSRLILASTPNPAAAASPLLDITNPARVVPLPQLGEGEYYWIVQGESTGGVNVSAAAQSFRIGSPPHIAAVALISPVNNARFDKQFLRQNRSVTFSWRASQEANAYILSIYRADRRARGRAVFQSQPLRQTNFAFTQLSLLDNGSFIWTVEPVFASSQGNLERRGDTRESLFNVDISLPRTEALSNEETYGF